MDKPTIGRMKWARWRWKDSKEVDPLALHRIGSLTPTLVMWWCKERYQEDSEWREFASSVLPRSPLSLLWGRVSRWLQRWREVETIISTVLSASWVRRRWQCITMAHAANPRYAGRGTLVELCFTLHIHILRHLQVRNLPCDAHKHRQWQVCAGWITALRPLLNTRNPTWSSLEMKRMQTKCLTSYHVCPHELNVAQ